MDFKGKREIYVTEDISPFFAKAAKMIFNDLGIDFDRAVIDYADEECIDLNIDGDDKTLYYEQSDNGFAYKLVDTDDYDDLTTAYEGYDDGDEDEDGSDLFDDDDMEGNFNNPYFQIGLSVILNALDIDPEQAEIELLYYDEEEIGLDIDGKDAVIHIDLDSEHPFELEWLNHPPEDEEDGEEYAEGAEDEEISGGA